MDGRKNVAFLLKKLCKDRQGRSACASEDLQRCSATIKSWEVLMKVVCGRGWMGQRVQLGLGLREFLLVPPLAPA